MNVGEYVDYFAAVLGGFLGYFFGGVNGFLYALITFTVLDYITGLLSAGVKHELCSKVGFKGIAKKITIFVLVGVANIIDNELLKDHRFLRDAVLCFYIANEGISILENAVTIGLPIPSILKDKLLQFKDSNEKKEEKALNEGKDERRVAEVVSGENGD